MDLNTFKNIKKTKNIFGEKWLRIAVLLIFWDIVAIHASYFLALWLRFDCRFSAISSSYLTQYYRSITLYSVAAVVIFFFFRLYQSVWKYASVDELLRCVGGSVLASLLYASMRMFYFLGMPRSYHVFGLIIQLCLIIFPRFLYRFYLSVSARYFGSDRDQERIMIIGAGSSGQMLLKDLKNAREMNARCVCLIDDDPNKQGRYIEGVRVVGGRDEILSAVKQYKVDKIFLSIPRASAEDKRDILNICKETDCKLMQLPAMYQLALGEVSLSNMREVSIEDLLGRDTVKTDLSEVFQFIHGKTVLVTGGGGSIGSELCRQIAAHSPERLIIFDVYENSAYAIQLELREKYPELKLEVLIGSVRDSRRMFQVFEEYRPQIVYHAAAHKHVPLMEDSPCESIKNNVLGTYKTAYAAMVHGCERFVLISTDKAVNPTNVMGASKRCCEMIVQYLAQQHEGCTEFVATRFGNVLGSNGSVIPIFKKQIEQGKPVTVTHPDIIRYFMTIPEAVSLVMEAAAMAKGGEIFVLDMGKPVKIVTLAENLIRMYGKEPYVDVPIRFTGLRPGEKIKEELLMQEEGLKKTSNKLIFIGKQIEIDEDAFIHELCSLRDAAQKNNEVAAIQALHKIVPTFVTPEEFNKNVLLGV